LPGYVVCAACGTRIKAGRGHCLRCFEPLPDPDTPVLPPIWESLGLSQGNLMIVGVVFAALVLSLGTLIWKTWPRDVDEEARPATTAPATAAAPAGAAPAGTPGGVGASDGPIVAPGYQPMSASAADPAQNGNTALTGGDPAVARAAYEQALVETPNDPEALNNLGQALLRLGRTGEAITRFERAIAIAPGKARYHFNLARTVAQLGHLDQAIAEYREAVRQSPDDYNSQFNLATALQERGDTDAAIPEFQKAVTLAPGEPTFRIALGLSLERAGRSADAVSEYRQFIQMAPASPDVPRLKAHIEALSTALPVQPSAS
jgi:Flp pilus assembly protein TadD